MKSSFPLKWFAVILVVLIGGGDSTVYSLPSTGHTPENKQTGVRSFTGDTSAVSVSDRVIHKEESPETAQKRKRKLWGNIWLTTALVVAVTITSYLLLKKIKKENPPGKFREVEWVEIPAGSFLMGDNTGLGEPDERPVHEVYLDTYSISKYEITYAQYDTFCEETHRRKVDDERGRGQYPVPSVNWFDAAAFCEWLSQRTGENVNLPTEAQWEKAARGTDQRIYPWGNQVPNCQLVNFGDCLLLSHKVGSHPGGQSPYGVHDMAGNVVEWCRDWYAETYYSQSPFRNPQGAATGDTKVIRGGSCSSMTYDYTLRTYTRERRKPDSMFVGFRVVKE